MDAALQGMIESVVNDKVQAGEMFTAWDVTKEVRSRGHNERHNNMKQVVHDYYGRGAMGSDYTRTLVPIQGAPIPAFLYHRYTDDATTYNPTQPRAATSPAAVAAAVGGFYAQGKAADDDDDGDADGDANGDAAGGVATLAPPASLPKLAVNSLRKPDSRGTVCIPAKHLRACGFKPKDTVHVWTKDGNTLTVQKPSYSTGPGSGKPLAKYTVDENNNVRITKTPLATIAVPAGGYTFGDTGSEVLVQSN